jgi:hypothetical protein
MVQRGVMKVSRLMPNIGSGAVVLASMSLGGLGGVECELEASAMDAGHRGEG